MRSPAWATWASSRQARDAGRKYGITLLLLYQSARPAGRAVGQGGRARLVRLDLLAPVRRGAGPGDGAGAVRHLRRARGGRDQPRREHRLRGAASPRTSSGRSREPLGARRALIRPDEILQDARADEAFVLVRGGRPLRCGRAVYFRRPELLARVARNRFAPAAAVSRPAADGR